MCREGNERFMIFTAAAGMTSINSDSGAGGGGGCDDCGGEG